MICIYIYIYIFDIILILIYYHILIAILTYRCPQDTTIYAMDEHVLTIHGIIWHPCIYYPTDIYIYNHIHLHIHIHIHIRVYMCIYTLVYADTCRYCIIVWMICMRCFERVSIEILRKFDGPSKRAERRILLIWSSSVAKITKNLHKR